MKALLVDDDSHHLDMTAYILRREGFVVEVAADGRDALRRCEDVNPDIVLLDISMPSVDGFEMLRTIRTHSSVPTVIVSARTDVQDVVRGLRLGADDYIAKPFNPSELVARIEAILRRTRNGKAETASEVQAGGMVLEVESHQVRRGSLRARITPLEFRLLYPLMLNVGRVVAASRLVEQAWGFEGGDTSMLKTHISHLRKKLSLTKGQPGYVEGIPSVGYVLHA